MASPLCLLLFGVIAGVLADYEDQDTTRLFFSNDGTALSGTSEDLLSSSSNGMDDEIIEIFKNSKKDIIGSDDPTSILGKALHSVPEERRKILVDFLNSNEHLGNGRALQMLVHTNVSAGTKTSSVGTDTPRNDSDAELRKSLKAIETILIVVNNSLPYKLQENDHFKLLVGQTRLTITSCNPLTFEDIKPIFLALRDTSFALYDYVENITQASEVDLADIALYDILRKLCDIATKLNPDRGELLKSFFNYHLGAGIRYTGKTIWEHFDSIGKVATAASFW